MQSGSFANLEREAMASALLKLPRIEEVQRQVRIGTKRHDQSRPPENSFQAFVPKRGSSTTHWREHVAQIRIRRREPADRLVGSRQHEQ